MSDLILTNYENLDDHRFKVTHVQDCTDILAANQKDRMNTDENWSKSKEMKHVARIPMAVWLEWEKLGITKDDTALKKAINLHQQYKTTNKEL